MPKNLVVELPKIGIKVMCDFLNRRNSVFTKEVINFI